MPIHHRSLRHTTWVILAVWLFALSAGVAHACLLTERVHGGHASLQAMPQDAAASESQHSPQTGHTDAGCLKFCDEAPLAIPKVDQPIADGGSGWVGALYRTSPPTVASATAAHLRLQADSPAHLASPIAARPHRLTL